MDGRQELLLAIGNSSRESVGTSLEVLTGNSMEGSIAAYPRMQHKARAPATRFKVKHETNYMGLPL